MIGKCIPLHEDEKTRIQANLIKTLRNGVPEQEPGCNYDALKTAEEWWSDLQESQEQRPLTIHASDIACFGTNLLHVVICPFTQSSYLCCYFSGIQGWLCRQSHDQWKYLSVCLPQIHCSHGDDSQLFSAPL